MQETVDPGVRIVKRILEELTPRELNELVRSLLTGRPQDNYLTLENLMLAALIRTYILETHGAKAVVPASFFPDD